jgi:hypothetical protein
VFPAFNRRSLVLGMKACCRMGEEVRALEIYKHLHRITDGTHLICRLVDMV